MPVILQISSHIAVLLSVHSSPASLVICRIKLSYLSVNIGFNLKTVTYTRLLTIFFMPQIIVECCSNTTIKVRSTTRDRLAKLGTKAHTYDMIIVELLDQLEVESQ